MFIKSLIISKLLPEEKKVIREIFFRKGINLIVDETPDHHDQETGNGIGKTTVLMLIDFCLGGTGKEVYTNSENKKEYKPIKDFLTENNVLVSLTLKENLDEPFSEEVLIERNFLLRNSRIQRVNGIHFSNEEEFLERLTSILWKGHAPKKPSFRQLISHNIRYKDSSVNNTIKTLNSFTTNAEYETLYLFLLGCPFNEGDTKQKLLTDKRLEEAFKKRLESIESKAAYESLLALTEAQIERLEHRKANFNLDENFGYNLERFNQLKYEVDFLHSEIVKLKLRRNIILEAKQKLQSKLANIDIQQLESIYRQATSQVAGIQKKFEEMLEFHNLMIIERSRYITSELPELEDNISSKQDELEGLLREQNILAAQMKQHGSFEDLSKLDKQLNESYLRKGEYQEIIQQLSTVENNLNTINAGLKAIDDVLFSQGFGETVKSQVNKFNEYFSTVSESLYGEKYALKADLHKKEHIYKFEVFDAKLVNSSSGKKQGEIACFDIAYTLFADAEEIPCFHFLLNDKKELMHDNQLIKIAELVNRKGIQFITPILKDKLPTALNREEYFVIQLSQEDKLFRIEHTD